MTAPDPEPDGDADDSPLAAHPAPGVPVALEPDDLPNRPLTVDRLMALLAKRIG